MCYLYCIINEFLCIINLGPKSEKTDGFDSDGVILPVSRLLSKVETAPSHIYDELAKNGQRPGICVVRSHT